MFIDPGTSFGGNLFETLETSVGELGAHLFAKRYEVGATLSGEMQGRVRGRGRVGSGRNGPWAMRCRRCKGRVAV